ncbi:hypothetical protein REPUB_Repub09cG0171300 [Reevesia pubescens]
MVRLSFQIPLDCVVLVSWLQLLHDYFQELLCQSLTEVGDQDHCLEDSFYVNLINPSKDTGKHCPSVTGNSCSGFDSISDLSCYGRQKGLSELYTWLSKHLPVDMLVDHETYMEKCINFSFSFLKLYVYEDHCLEDSPFMLSISDGEVHSMHSRHLQRQAIFLFLRFSFSLINPSKDIGKHCPSVTGNSCSGFDSISDLSCYGRQKGLSELYTWLSKHLPVDMLVDHETYMEKCINFSFSFLKLYVYELHYDHQVLLDYLISKDTGISCAEYLLRCLRLVCDSWQKFTEFSMYWEVKNQSSSKRRIFLSESSNRTIELSSGPTKTIPLYLEKKVKGDLEYRCVEQAYEQAKDCLLSLKKSVENHHPKNLFPYNPEVLLKRLTRFQELCFKQ